MKAKLRGPEVAKANGADYVRKLLKKNLLEDIVEPVQFFYHAGFQYDGAEGLSPVMFIGEVPTLWKNWIKTVKSSTSFVAGRCLFNAKTKELKLEIKLGKGGKASVLKIVQKGLLKPFANAVFVESIESNKVLEDVAEKNEAPELEEGLGKLDDIADYVKEIAEFYKEGTAIKTRMTALVKGLGGQLKNVSQIVVTDKLIADAKKAVEDLDNLNILDYQNEKKVWLKDIPKEILSHAEFAPELVKLNALEKELVALIPHRTALIRNCGLLQKVENPVESAVPPISDNPITNFGMVLHKIKPVVK